MGYVLARAFAFAIGYMRDVVMAEVTLSVALAYITFYVAEANLGVSGVIAVVIASMTFASFGRTTLSPGAWDVLWGTWRILDFWATSLIFVLAAMVVPQTFLAFEAGDMIVIVLIFVSTLAARFIGLYGLVPILTSNGISDPIPSEYKKVILWGGLRGAVTIALALAVVESPLIPEDIGRFVLVGSTGYVLATLLLQAPTLRSLMRMLKMDKLSASERQVKARVLEVSQSRVHEQIQNIAIELGLGANSRSTSVPKQQDEMVLRATSQGDQNIEFAMAKEDRLQVAILAIASRENELYFEFLQKGIVSRKVLQILIAHSSRMIDGAKSNGLEGYQSAAFGGLQWHWQLRMALWVQRRFGLETDLAHLLAERFEALLIAEIAIHELLKFANATIKELIGTEAVEVINTALQARLASLVGALEAVEVQFPTFAERLYQRYLDRVALGFEESQYRQQLSQSVISPEVYEELESERRIRQKELELQPPLDLGLRLSKMLGDVPFFSTLGHEALEKVARQLKPRLGLPGEKIITEGDEGRCMFFIVSGAVTVHLADGDKHLTQGDYVGEMALVTRQPRNANVIVNGYCHLLVLERRDFQRLFRALPGLRQHIEKTANERLQERNLDNHQQT